MNKAARSRQQLYQACSGLAFNPDEREAPARAGSRQVVLFSMVKGVKGTDRGFWSRGLPYGIFSIDPQVERTGPLRKHQALCSTAIVWPWRSIIRGSIDTIVGLALLNAL